ncbi:MAG: GNAT family N-acetyltransferase [Lachnospiraceae bacterium]|nr:GNAT family N-acetyltransferase [Lachnospiraceae bacterium]
MEYRKISPDAAREAKGYLMPEVQDHPDFEELLFYGAVKEDGGLTGLLAIDPDVEDAQILSIGMSPEYCRKGYGSELLRFAMRDLVSLIGEASLDFLPLRASFRGEASGEDPLGRFLVQNGFFPESQCPAYCIPLSVMAKAPMLKEAMERKTLSGVLPLKEAPDYAVNALSARCRKDGLYPGISRAGLDEEISMCYLPDREIEGCVLFEKEMEGTLQNTWMYVSEEASGKMVFPMMLSEALKQALKSCPEDTGVSILAAEEESRELLEKIFPGEEPVSEYLTYIRILSAGRESLPEADDPVFEEVTEEGMCCRDCALSKGQVFSCGKYKRKPDAVINGEGCLYYEVR